MKEHFTELIDFNFTAGVEEDLDAIARGEKRKVEWLKHFYFGDDVDENIPGLKKIVSNNLDTIDAAEINTVVLGKHPDTGDVIIVKPGQYGPFVRCAENTAGVPDSMAPDELTVDAAIALLNAPKGDEPIGEIDGHPVFAKSGRYGPYVQWGTMDEPPAGLEKPKTASLFKTMNIDRITMKDATDLLSLPRTLGADPTDGEIITAQNGPYGPYISKGKEKRSLQTEEQLLEVTLDEALALLAQPRVYGRGRSAPKPPLREFGNDPVSGKPVVAKEGRFGDYVTDGETNAGLTRGDRLEEMTNERAYELLQLRREYIAEHGTKKKPARKKAAAKKATPAKKSAGAKKKATPKKKAAPKKKASDTESD
jgi:DNA topoisomerase-1